MLGQATRGSHEVQAEWLWSQFCKAELHYWYRPERPGQQRLLALSCPLPHTFLVTVLDSQAASNGDTRRHGLIMQCPAPFFVECDSPDSHSLFPDAPFVFPLFSVPSILRLPVTVIHGVTAS